MSHNRGVIDTQLWGLCHSIIRGSVPTVALTSSTWRFTFRTACSNSVGCRLFPAGQGLTLVRFSDHHKRFLWDRVCM
jgi:hypothetical protein